MRLLRATVARLTDADRTEDAAELVAVEYRPNILTDYAGDQPAVLAELPCTCLRA